MQTLRTLWMLVLIALAVAQAPPPPWQDPNAQTEGFQAALTGAALQGNPLGLKPAQVQQEGMDAPNAGVTFSSQHNADASRDAATLWSWEVDAYNVEDVGLTTVHNLKEPSWPVVYTLFASVSSPDFAPINNGELQKADLDKLAQGLTDGSGRNLGYKEIFAAVNASALGVVARLASDPTQAIFGILGNDLGDSPLTGGIEMPVDDETYIPLTDEELAQLGIPPSADNSSADAPAGGAPQAGPASAAPAARGLPAAAVLAAGALLCAGLAA